ncbi:hypothetical protein [Leptospira kirschneri]|uniref:Uncharacterized protein n=1 Tax=Leptospira kirschneri serovar Bulgarica str. Nikolaevo TaxID=1240687 RepID=M6F5X1_9LEPT|nr:hypothetical protein [Leptospira kirschneri]EMK22412.1 hypothetical protein LEP1GSC008_1568 [Leptospira kirschneri serovar Bulgarica str. Nikolaevo]EMK24540.1 hypothetical protein LEP1GSC008_2641 [Leptospira kirschneri serovar Bulgarica str. Nikolaevo]EMK24880.1 hypothetical protein LEP1GSC008_0589 [Leptospira kirschneri serovar Bulgarica str. Nikolaevo]
MANVTKFERIRKRFLCDHSAELRDKGVIAHFIFDRCWNKIPNALIKKLNSEELLSYIKIHILPGEVASTKGTSKNEYKSLTPKEHKLEKFA